MNKKIKIILSIILAINILAICVFSCVIYRGILYNTYIESDPTGTASINGVDLNVSFIDLLKLRFSPNSIDVNQANKTVLSNISHDKSYTNYEYNVIIKNFSLENAYWLEFDVEVDDEQSHGFMTVMYGDNPMQECEFYTQINGDNVDIYLLSNGVWYNSSYNKKIITDYHITNIISSLPDMQFASFPKNYEKQNWSFKIKNSFLKSISTAQDGRFEYFEAALITPSNGESQHPIWKVIPGSNMTVVYQDRGNCGNIKINMPDFKSLDVQPMPTIDE